MTIEDQTPAITSPSGDAAAPKEKKSVLKLVKDKAKDKVKRIGSKLKPSKGHDNGSGTDKQPEAQELVDQAGEDEDEEVVEPSGDTPPLDSTSRDLDVPLDEYALIKQKEAENKDDEASTKSGLGTKLTEGLSSQSIAEQEATDEASPDVLQAVPTEYNYKEEETGKENDVPVSSERSWPEEDLSLKTQGQVGDSEEQTTTPTVTPREPEKGDGETIFASKDGSSPEFTDRGVEELSSSNLYTGEPDVKPKDDNTGAGVDEEPPKEDETTGKDEASVFPKPEEEQEELKENVPSAESKLEDEASANVNFDGDKNEVKETSADETPEQEANSDEKTDRSLDVGGEGFADAKPVLSSTDEAADNEVIGEDSGESEKPGVFEDSSSEGLARTDKQEAEFEAIGKDSGTEPAPASEDSSSKDVEQKEDLTSREADVNGDLANASTNTQASSETGDALEKTLGSSGAEKSDTEIKEEQSEVAPTSDSHVSEQAPTSDIGQATEVSEDALESPAKEETAPASDSRDIKQDDNVSKEREGAPVPSAEEENEGEQPTETVPPASEDSGVTKKLNQLKESIATTLGYGSPKSDENVKAEQERIVDAKAKQLVGGDS